MSRAGAGLSKVRIPTSPTWIDRPTDRPPRRKARAATVRRIAGLFQDVTQDLNARACIDLSLPILEGVYVSLAAKLIESMRTRPEGCADTEWRMLAPSNGEPIMTVASN